MSFVFASSHLPEVERPADEDEEEDVQPMRRSGGVRAFSHLPQTVRAAPAGPRPSGPAPASRPAWAAAPESPSDHESADGHDHEPDDDAADDHGSGADTGPHEPEEGRPWYLPRITAADLQPEGGGHDEPAKVNIGPVPRLSGGAGSFRPLPGHVEDDAADTGHADAGSHVDFEPPATASGGNQGAIGPSSPRGAAPPAGRSLFLTPRPMPPEYARQMAKPLAVAPGSRGSASNSGYASPLDSGDKPTAKGSSSGKLTVPGVLAQGKIALDNYNKEMGQGGKTEAAAEPTVEMLEQKEKQLEAEANGARQALHNQLEVIKKRRQLRLVTEGAKIAQDKGKEGLPKGVEVPFDYGMDKLGLSPDKVIEKIDADIEKRQNELLKSSEEVEKANMALQQAKMETAAARKKELEKKQKQPRKQPPVQQYYNLPTQTHT